MSTQFSDQIQDFLKESVPDSFKKRPVLNAKRTPTIVDEYKTIQNPTLLLIKDHLEDLYPVQTKSLSLYNRDKTLQRCSLQPGVTISVPSEEELALIKSQPRIIPEVLEGSFTATNVHPLTHAYAYNFITKQNLCVYFQFNTPFEEATLASVLKDYTYEVLEMTKDNYWLVVFRSIDLQPELNEFLPKLLSQEKEIWYALRTKEIELNLSAINAAGLLSLEDQSQSLEIKMHRSAMERFLLKYLIKANNR